MDLYIKWKLRQIYKHFYTILISLLFQFLQLLELVCCFFFHDESGSKMKNKRNSNQNEYQQTTIIHATFTVETLHFSKD